MSLDILNSKSYNSDMNIENFEKIKEKSEFELFNDFYEFQNSVKLDEEQSEIIKKVIEKTKN